MILDGKGLVEILRPQVNEIDCATMNQRLKDNNDLLFIDIREPNETAAGMAENSEAVPRGVLEMKLNNLTSYQALTKKLASAEEAPIYLMCRSGARSILAAASLQQMGYKNVYSVAGGFLDWKAQGFAINNA